jgi:hypothetical protein
MWRAFLKIKKYIQILSFGISFIRVCGIFCFQLDPLAVATNFGEEMEIERRQFPRFSVAENTFAALRPHFNKLGTIKDISRGGLAFEYIALEARGGDESAIDIFLTGNGFYLSRIPCKVVYDTQMVKEEGAFQHLIEMRRCGIQFGELEPPMAEQLSFFLDHYTKEPL